MGRVVGSFSEEVLGESVRSYVRKERYSVLGTCNRSTRDRDVQSQWILATTNNWL